jgi:CDP-archaeol synthase
VHSPVADTLQVLYLFAPLVLSSALSGIVLRFDLLPALRKPIDAGKTVFGRRLFGDNKTWRGVATALAGCIASVAAQKYMIGPHAGWLAVARYDELNPLLFGAAFGMGAMGGELPNSFVKRQLGVRPGEATSGILAVLFYIWDQIDLLAVWPFIAFWVRPTLRLVSTSIAVALVLHPLISLIGYIIGARRSAR